MLDSKRREFIALVGGGGLLLAVKVKRARGQLAGKTYRVGWLGRRLRQPVAMVLFARRVKVPRGGQPSSLCLIAVAVIFGRLLGCGDERPASCIIWVA